MVLYRERGEGGGVAAGEAVTLSVFISPLG